VPIYEYRCKKCGEVFEAFQRITDKPLTKCRFCEGKVEQLISHSSFQFKGAGWYLTDYARKSKSSSQSGSSCSTKSEASSDSKPSKEE
jgi:putative FmdB family regulatory protein